MSDAPTAPEAHAPEKPAPEKPLAIAGAFDVPSAAEPAETPDPSGAPLSLEGLAHGIDALDGVVVFALSDARVHAVWIRSDLGFSADDVAAAMRDAYRACLRASRRLSIFSAAANQRTEPGEPLVTVETLDRTAILKRVRAHVVACLFDASMPLGMARLCAARLSLSLGPELPLFDPARGGGDFGSVSLAPSTEDTLSRASRPPPARRGEASSPPRASAAEQTRARRAVALAEARSPEPHTVRLRLALRAQVSPLSIDHVETLTPEALLRVDTAICDLLSIERQELAAATSEERHA